MCFYSFDIVLALFDNIFIVYIYLVYVFEMEIFIKMSFIRLIMDNSPDGKKRNFFMNIYENKYKPLMIISILLLLFSIGVIIYQVATTGDFVSKGITLKGGLTITVNTNQSVNSDEIQASLIKQYPKSDINVRSFEELGSYGFVVEASDLSEEQVLSSLKVILPNINTSDYSSELTGPSLGSAFFSQTLKAMFVAFIFMSLVVYLYFGHSLKLKWLTSFLSITAGLLMFYANSVILYILPLLILAGLIVIYFKDNIPSFAIMLCAVSNIFFSLAIFDLMGLKLNTAGVAAFLMLVGYSIDTDILLSVRVLKRKEGTIFERTVDAMKTGMMMTLSALIAVLTAYFFTSSAVIKEIMFILAAGLFSDIIFTWIQNAGILRWHLEKKGWK
jgi:preprotein translocase subunit SecF